MMNQSLSALFYAHFMHFMHSLRVGILSNCFERKNGGAWAARTPDHLIKSQVQNVGNSITWGEFFYAFSLFTRRRNNNLRHYFMHFRSKVLCGFQGGLNDYLDG